MLDAVPGPVWPRTPAIVAAAVTAAMLASVGAQQTPPRSAAAGSQQTGTGVIAGRVFDAVAGAPLPGAQVSLTGQPPLNQRLAAAADAGGAFAFNGLPPGAYMVAASRAGYLRLTYGQTRPGSASSGRPVTIADGERAAIDIGLPRGGAITGRVLDDHGLPATGAIVRVQRRTIQSGAFVLQGAGSATVDDRGVYRAFGLLPGTYLVSVSGLTVHGSAQAVRIEALTDSSGGVTIIQPPRQVISLDRPETGRATVFYSNASVAADAEQIVLGVGDERSGVDLMIRTVPVATVEGTVVNAGGDVPMMVNLTLQEHGSMPGSDRPSTQTPTGSAFAFQRVPPGQYTIEARVSLRRTVTADRSEWTELWWARSDVMVSGARVSHLLLTLQPGQTVSGQATFVGASPLPMDALKQTRVALRPPGYSPATTPVVFQGQLDERGGLTVTGVPPGTYLVQATAGPSLGSARLVSAIVGGRETLDDLLEVPEGRNVTGLQLTFSDRITELSGALTDAGGAPRSGHTIVAFPADRRFWTPHSRRITAAETGADGRYRLRGLPPGDYLLVTLLEPEPESWLDPDVLRQLVGASVAVRLNDGESRVQDLRITR